MNLTRKAISYIILSVFGIFMIMPFAWMIITSAKSQLEVNKPKISFLPIDDFDVMTYQNKKHNVKIIKTEGEFTWIHIFDEDGGYYVRPEPLYARCRFFMDGNYSPWNLLPICYTESLNNLTEAERHQKLSEIENLTII